MDGNQPQPGGDGTGTGTPTGNPTPNPAATVDPAKIDLPEGFELIRTVDKNAIISDRDKTKNALKQAETAAQGSGQTEAILNGLLQENAVKDFLAEAENKSKYPDVTAAELLEGNPESDEDIAKIAEAKQARYEAVKQAHMKKVQVATAPSISAADKVTQLKDLEKPSSKSRFRQALSLGRMQVK